MAGLLTYPNPFAPSRNQNSNDILQQDYRDLQQRVLSRTFTGFPFHPPAFAWGNHIDRKITKKIITDPYATTKKTCPIKIRQ